jgi:hypothetical protein
MTMLFSFPVAVKQAPISSQPFFWLLQVYISFKGKKAMAADFAQAPKYAPAV